MADLPDHLPLRWQDPLQWDNARLARELTSSPRSWKPPQQYRLQNPETVAANILKNDLDGYTLLTYEDAWGAQMLHELFAKELGITSSREKTSLKFALRILQKSSPEYQQQKVSGDLNSVANTAKHEAEIPSLPPMAPPFSVPSPNPTSSRPSMPPFEKEASDGISYQDSILPSYTESQAQPSVTESAMEIDAPVKAETGQKRVRSLSINGTQHGDLIGQHASTHEATSQKPAKKPRRIAPTMVSTTPTGTLSMGLPNEADSFLMPFAQDTLPKQAQSTPRADTTWDALTESRHGPTAFLGKGGLKVRQETEAVLEETLQVEQHRKGSTRSIARARKLPPRRCTLMESPDLDEKGFQMATSKMLPPARRKQVRRTLEAFLTQKVTIPAEDSEGNEASDDELLPVYGESDEDYDDETWREVEADRKEDEIMAEKQRVLAARSVTKGDAILIMDEAIEEMELEWTEIKKPKLDLTAHKVWKDAHKHRNRRVRIKRIKERIETLDDRIVKHKEAILKEKWSVGGHVKSQCRIMEETIFERQSCLWELEVLASPQPPAKPPSRPPAKARAKKATRLMDDEEIIGSDDDGDDGFIDDTELPLPDENESDFGEPDHRRLGTLKLKSGNMMQDAIEIDDSAPPSPPAESAQDQSDHMMQDVMEIPPPPPAESAQDQDSIPPFTDLSTIENLKAEYWEKRGDAERLVIAVLMGRTPASVREQLLYNVLRHDSTRLWRKCILGLERDTGTVRSDAAAALASFSWNLAQLFDAYIHKTAKRVSKRNIGTPIIEAMQRADSQPKFTAFHALLVFVASHISRQPDGSPPTEIDIPDSPHGASAPDHGDGVRDSEDVQMEDVYDSDHYIPEQDLPELDEPNTEDEEEDLLMEMNKVEVVDTTPSTTRHRDRQPRDRRALNIQHKDKEWVEELRKRRKANLPALLDTVPHDRTRLVINDGKEAGQGVIYVNNHIGQIIKDHQVAGVRFLWDALVARPGEPSGGLLAHAMGLGKTLQVITLLIAIVEASHSTDSTIFSQIPTRFRNLRPVIVCPASVLDNWINEIEMWDTQHLLGDVYKVDSSLVHENSQLTNIWATHGGVLLLSYTRLQRLKKFDLSRPIYDLLTQTANIVVTDEAHFIKNSEAQHSEAVAGICTPSRIAITGSPLTNNLEDYYHMVNWVAEGYLGDKAEFMRVWANPIRGSMYTETSTGERRQAAKLLHALTKVVEPKVHRLGINVLKSLLPDKKEYIVRLRLSEVQQKAYRIFVQATQNDANLLERVEKQNATTWSLIAQVNPLLAAPIIFRQRLKERLVRLEQAKSSASEDKSAKKDKNSFPAHCLDDLLASLALRELEDIQYAPKVAVLMRILEEAKQIGDKVLVFSQCLPTLDYLQGVLSKRKYNFTRLDGQTVVKKRQARIDNFNSAEGADIFLISTKAGGVGLNMQSANRVVIFDHKYAPTDEQQAIGRAYRYGQKKDVFVYWLLIGGTYEDLIHNSSVHKRQLASAVVDKKNIRAWSTRNGSYFADPFIPVQKDLAPFQGQDRVLDCLIEEPSFRGMIRNIVATDVFEEEELVELTEEELKESEAHQAKLAQNRLSETTMRRSEQRSMAAGAALENHFTISNSVQTTTTPGPVLQSHFTSQPEQTSIASSAMLPANYVTPTPIQTARARQEESVSFAMPNAQPQSVAAHQPVLGHGTSYRPVTSQPQSIEGQQKRHEPNEKAKLDKLAATLTAAAMKVPQSNEVDDMVPSTVAEIGHQAIKRYNHVLERLDFLGNLERCCQQHPRFAIAVITRRFPPELLVCAGKTELQSLVAGFMETCAPMSEEQFRTKASDTNRRNKIADSGNSDHVPEAFAQTPKANTTLRAPGPTTPARGTQQVAKRGRPRKRGPGIAMSTPQRPPRQSQIGCSPENPQIIDD